MCDCKIDELKEQQVRMANLLASIADSLKVIAESSTASAEVFRKWNCNGLPPGFVEMNEAWQQRWSAV